jgi:hypothetical protein
LDISCKIRYWIDLLIVIDKFASLELN